MNIKKMLQAPLRSRQTARYEARIKEQTVRYHDWILRKEEKERSGRVLEGTGLFVKCVPYGACRASFQVQEAGRDADILVFHADCGKPEEEALRLFADFFARNPEAVLAYGDEDEVLPENGGRRTNPWLKPDWSPDTLISYFYMGNEGPDIYFARADAFAAMQGWTDVNYPYLSISPTPFEDVEIPDPDEPATEPEQPFNFTDVKGNDWFYDSVDYVNASGIMTGLDATTFGPNEKLARAQLAVILHRMNEEPEMTYSALFPDVPDEQWFTDAILWAADVGVVAGYSDTGLFGTGDNINREQIATMMYRYARYKGYSLEDAADFSSYPDAAYVNEFAEEAMAWAVGNGIITGKENPVRLDPQGLATRAECATIIMRFMETFEK